MPKLGMQRIRRQQLIAATIATIHRHGFGDATVQRIAAAAGVSTGIVHHYFRGKDDLLETSMRHLLEELRRDLLARYTGCTTPLARLRAVLDANFAPEQFRPETISAWLAFWAQSEHQRGLARLRRIYSRRLESNLLAPLRRLLPKREAARVAVTLTALVDGFWLRAGDRNTEFDRKDALAHVHAYLDLALGRAKVASG